jgi:hypothetical protein
MHNNPFRKVRPGSSSPSLIMSRSFSTISSYNRIVEQRQESKGLAKFTLECPPRDTAPVAVFSPLQLREQSPRHYGNTLCA